MQFLRLMFLDSVVNSISSSPDILDIHCPFNLIVVSNNCVMLLFCDYGCGAEWQNFISTILLVICLFGCWFAAAVAAALA